MWPWSRPPTGKSAPPAPTTFGSSVAWPSALSSQRPGSLPPSRFVRLVSPMVVIEVLMSIRIGSGSAGMPAAIGFGVMTGVTPPNGATCASLGSDEKTSTTMPWRAGCFEEGGEAGDVVDCAGARSRRGRGAARARPPPRSPAAVVQMPGSRRASQVATAPARAPRSGPPSLPSRRSRFLDIVGKQRQPVRGVAERSASTSPRATLAAGSSGSPASVRAAFGEVALSAPCDRTCCTSPPITALRAGAPRCARGSAAARRA